MIHQTKPVLPIHALGSSGELLAARFVEEKGFEVLAKNYKTRQGEVDVIAKKDDIIAFIEVKTRSARYFHASHLITPAKQRKIALAAQHFIQEHNLNHGFVLRFDAVFVSPTENGVEFEYVPNAFQSPR